MPSCISSSPASGPGRNIFSFARSGFTDNTAAPDFFSAGFFDVAPAFVAISAGATGSFFALTVFSAAVLPIVPVVLLITGLAFFRAGAFGFMVFFSSTGSVAALAGAVFSLGEVLLSFSPASREAAGFLAVTADDFAGTTLSAIVFAGVFFLPFSAVFRDKDLTFTGVFSTFAADGFFAVLAGFSAAAIFLEEGPFTFIPIFLTGAVDTFAAIFLAAGSFDTGFCSFFPVALGFAPAGAGFFPAFP